MEENGRKGNRNIGKEMGDVTCLTY